MKGNTNTTDLRAVYPSKSYNVTSTYAYSSGQKITVNKKDNIVYLPLITLKDLPYGQNVTVATISDVGYRPAFDVNYMAFDTISKGYVRIKVEASTGIISAYSWISNSSGTFNIGSGTLVYSN